jgi:biotin transport system permease protein
MVIGSPVVLAALLVAVAAGYAVARIPVHRVTHLVRLLAPLLVLVVAVQVWLLGPLPATVLGLRLLIALGMANLFTLTTRVDDVVAAVERGLAPLHRFGVRPDRVGMIVGMTVAAVGTLAGIAGEVREAALARGADRSITAFVVPFLVRTVRHADELGEALAARGVGDEES